MSRTSLMNSAISSGVYGERTRACDPGFLLTHIPGRRSVAGLIGRGSNPPPQFGHTFASTWSTHAAQKVHSKLQMRASLLAGGKSLSQYSQFGFSIRAMRRFHDAKAATPLERQGKAIRFNHVPFHAKTPGSGQRIGAALRGARASRNSRFELVVRSARRHCPLCDPERR